MKIIEGVFMSNREDPEENKVGGMIEYNENCRSWNERCLITRLKEKATVEDHQSLSWRLLGVETNARREEATEKGSRLIRQKVDQSGGVKIYRRLTG